MYVHLLSSIYCSYDTHEEEVYKHDSSLKHIILCMHILVAVYKVYLLLTICINYTRV